MHYLENIIPLKVANKNTVLVTSNDIKHQILKYRDQYKIIDNLKIITEREFEQQFGFESNPELLYYLINNNPWGTNKLQVSVAKQLEIAIFIIIAQEINDHKLVEYINQLGALAPAKPTLPNYSFEFYLPRISDLSAAISKVDYQFASKQEYSVVEYNYYLDEIEQTIEQIISQLQSGIKFEQIHLIAPANYHQLIKQVAMVYNLPVADQNQLPLLSHDDGRSAYHALKCGEPIVLEELDPAVAEAVISIVNKYAKYDVVQYWDLIAADFEQETITINKGSGIELKSKIDSRYTLQNLANDHFFLLGNYQDGLVSYHLDTNIISDQQRKQLPTADFKNKVEDSLLYNLLNNANHITVSYAVKLLDKEVTLANNLSGSQIIAGEVLATSNYSQANDQLRYARSNYIKETFNMETKAYQSLSNYFEIEYYQNNFTPISRTYQDLKLSYTSINDYYKCSYKFYLAHILRIKNGKFDNRKVLIGNIVHYVLENIDNFTDLTSANIKQIIETYTTENQIAVQPVDQLYFDKFSIYLEAVCVYMKQEEANSGFDKIEREMSFEMQLAENITLIGKIDKILSKLEGDNLFVEIYDYKTGSLNIDISGVEYGLNMQNLIYFLLLKDYYKHEAGDEVLNGTYQHQIKQKLLYDESEILDTMKIKGYSKLKHDNVFKRTEKLISEPEVDELLATVTTKVNSAADAIVANKFEINPKIIKGKNQSCDYCDYAGICNKTINDFKFIN